MFLVSIDEPVGTLSFFKIFVAYFHNDALVIVGSIEISGTGNESQKFSGLYFIEKHLCNMFPYGPFPAWRINWRFLGHMRKCIDIIHIHIVEENKSGVILYTGVEYSLHKFRPLRLPYIQFIIQSHNKIYYLRPFYSSINHFRF